MMAAGENARESSRSEEFVNRQHRVENFDHVSGRELFPSPRFDFPVESDIAALNHHLRLTTSIRRAAKLQELIQPKRSGLTFFRFHALRVRVCGIRSLSRCIVCHGSP